MDRTRSLSVRNYAGAQDAERIAELTNTSRAATGGERAPVSAEAVASFIEDSWAGFNSRTDVHLFFRDEMLVAYERIKRETWASGARAYHVLPFIRSGWRNQQVITEILEHICQCQSEYAKHDQGGAVPFLSLVPDPSDEAMIPLSSA